MTLVGRSVRGRRERARSQLSQLTAQPKQQTNDRHRILRSRLLGRLDCAVRHFGGSGHAVRGGPFHGPSALCDDADGRAAVHGVPRGRPPLREDDHGQLQGYGRHRRAGRLLQRAVGPLHRPQDLRPEPERQRSRARAARRRGAPSRQGRQRVGGAVDAQRPQGVRRALHRRYGLPAREHHQHRDGRRARVDVHGGERRRATLRNSAQFGAILSHAASRSR